eukprot:7057743-Pyramimonas_sp.AAC.1
MCFFSVVNVAPAKAQRTRLHNSVSLKGWSVINVHGALDIPGPQLEGAVVSASPMHISTGCADAIAV